MGLVSIVALVYKTFSPSRAFEAVEIRSYPAVQNLERNESSTEQRLVT